MSNYWVTIMLFNNDYNKQGIIEPDDYQEIMVRKKALLELEELTDYRLDNQQIYQLCESYLNIKTLLDVKRFKSNTTEKEKGIIIGILVREQTPFIKERMYRIRQLIKMTQHIPLLEKALQK